MPCPRLSWLSLEGRHRRHFAPGRDAGTWFDIAMTFILPLDMAEPEERPGREIAEKGAPAAGTPFVSFFKPNVMLAIAVEAGFKDVRHVSAAALEARYFAGRTDGLRPGTSESFLIATT